MVKLNNIFSIITQLMAGSLFFKGVNAVLDWIVKLSHGSFIVGLFTGDDEPQKAKLGGSMFVQLSETLFNKLHKPIRIPARWPRIVSSLSSGSWFIRTSTDALDTPIPPPVPNTGGGTILMWGAYALPIWALLAVVVTFPILPTMVAAGILAMALVFALFSRRFVLDGTAVFLLLFVIVTLVTGALSLARSTSIPIALLSSVIMLSTLTMTACLKTKNSVNAIIFGFVSASAIAGAVGIYHIMTGYGTRAWLDIVLFTDIGARLVSTFGNPNVYGTFLLLAIPLTAACIVYAKNNWLKLLAAGVTGILVLNLLATYSRGCYVALTVGVVVFVLIIHKQLIVLLIPALLMLPFVLPATVVNRLFSIFNPTDTSTVYRINIWRGTLRMLSDFWPIGVGQGENAFNMVYPYYSLGAIFTPHSHNLFMQILSETGIVGFVMFLGLLACFFRVHVNFLRRVKEFRLRCMSGAMVAAVVALLFQGIFDHAFYSYQVMMAFYLFIGLSIAFTRTVDPSLENENRSSSPKKSTWVSGYHD